MARATELAAALRSWRDRLTPAEVGPPCKRWSPSARASREELAALAGVSVDYLVRLEQGRSDHPSAQVLAALARAFRLDREERDSLNRCADADAPEATIVPRHLSPGLQHILDRLADTPVGVYPAAWELVEADQPWQALLGSPGGRPGRERNLAWSWFAHGESNVARTEAEYAEFARSMVTDLHATAARYPDDPELAAMRSPTRDERAAGSPTCGTATASPSTSQSEGLNRVR